MSLQNFLVFLAVMEEKSFSQAAKKLHLTQPAVSGQIKSLESDYGVALFERTSHGVHPTEAGELVAKFAKNIVQSHRDLDTALKELISGNHQTIALGASTIVGNYPLPCSFYVFKEENPEVDIRLEIANSQSIIEKLRKGEIDLAIVELSSVESTLGSEFVAIPCLNDELEFVVKYSDTWKDKASISLEELRKLPMIIREEGSGLRRIFESSIERSGLSLKSFNIFTEMSSIGAIKSSVEAGHGVALLPRICIKKEHRIHSLATLKIDGLNLKLSYYALHRKNQSLPYQTENFLKFIINKQKRAFC